MFEHHATLRLTPSNCVVSKNSFLLKDNTPRKHSRTLTCLTNLLAAQWLFPVALQGLAALQRSA
jgi:hypothetical protein